MIIKLHIDTICVIQMHQPLSNSYASFTLWLYSLHSFFFSKKRAKPNTVLNAIFTRLEVDRSVFYLIMYRRVALDYSRE